jgi:hypothetical protein
MGRRVFKRFDAVVVVLSKAVLERGNTRAFQKGLAKSSCRFFKVVWRADLKGLLGLLKRICPFA